MTVQQRMKDAALAALVAAILALPLLGFETVDTGGPLGIKTRWHYVGYAAAAVFIGRLLLMLWRDRRLGAQADSQAGGSEAGRAWLAKLSRKADSWLMPALIAFAVALPLMPFADRTVVDLGTVVLIYVMLGWGLNIVVGLAGLLDLGYVAFYAVGAYSYALLSKNFGLNFWECLPLAGLFAAMFGVALGFPVLRLRGDYLAIVTLGFGEIIRIVLLNWQPVTGGPNGISGIARPSFFGFPFTANPPEGTTAFHELFGLDFASTHRIVFLYYLILALALLTNLFTLRIRRLPVGRAWEALREDEIACRALGINPTNTKLTAFAIGAMFGGFAGSFFATRQGFISPESFTFIESAVILAIVVLGGMGSQAGIVLAAAFLTLLPELAREFSLFRMLAFGLAMVLIMVWRPQGLLSHRDPTIRLKPAAHGGGGGG
ncbi:high-affinity branched-chain amino acid ABC transporter permease LivM [Ferrovibrio sp.]|uniref:high-affinity branched-chain amino acid ABC transporter permease LivM n=1 Tax=Ferrovibrio sp. TaxID=1917215 RepID=UPI0025C5182E|nr:high-affinity branched-chain amino acid ABC transporter permease LivM [Ferrovibrio sp.]